jgi:hypothetical protein
MTGKAMLDPLVITGLRQKGIGAKKNSFWLTRYSNTPSTSPFSAAESRLSKGRDQCAQVNVLPAQDVNAYVCWNSSTPPEFKNVRYGHQGNTSSLTARYGVGEGSSRIERNEKLPKVLRDKFHGCQHLRLVLPVKKRYNLFRKIILQVLTASQCSSAPRPICRHRR